MTLVVFYEPDMAEQAVKASRRTARGAFSIAEQPAVEGGRL